MVTATRCPGGAKATENGAKCEHLHRMLTTLSPSAGRLDCTCDAQEKTQLDGQCHRCAHRRNRKWGIPRPRTNFRASAPSARTIDRVNTVPDMFRATALGSMTGQVVQSPRRCEAQGVQPQLDPLRRFFKLPRITPLLLSGTQNSGIETTVWLLQRVVLAVELETGLLAEIAKFGRTRGIARPFHRSLPFDGFERLGIASAIPASVLDAAPHLAHPSPSKDPYTTPRHSAPLVDLGRHHSGPSRRVPERAEPPGFDRAGLRPCSRPPRFESSLYMRASL
ncbi:hypothetical protein B0H14DRAFT_2632140 [Mycena olivaceomarginata]|nr:hypothetical protein B0H14DRAFT_2632140 [Mycena olivaceomarginata]